MTRRVDIRIDELVLDGVASVDPAAVSRELGRLIGERGLPGLPASRERVEVQLPGHAAAAHSVAAAVHQGVSGCSS